MQRPAILAAIRQRLESALTARTPSFVRFDVDGVAAGYLSAARAERLTQFPRVFVVDATTVRFVPALATAQARSAAMAEVAEALAAAGELTAWRDERYAVRASFDAPPWFMMERAAARWFGIRTWAVHVNGVAGESPGQRLWFARRSAKKSIDPLRFDTLVGGGIAGQESVALAMQRESWEEAGIAEALAATAHAAGHLRVTHNAADGLQRETIFVYDLALPEGFIPDNQDGEAIEHRSLTLDESAALIARDTGSDATTLDACVVTLDYLLRQAAFAIDGEMRGALAALCRLPVR